MDGLIIMDARQSKFAVKLLPSMADFAFLMPIVFLFGRMDGAKTLLGDCDAGWHIRTGQWILANHRVPVRDLFSFSKAGQPWYAWEWLADVLWAWLTAHGGLAALVLFCALLLSATFTLLYRLARNKANPVAALAVTLVAAAASSVHWLARPHLFTLFFAVLFCTVLERERYGRRRFCGLPLLVVLPAATILWTNLHGGFVAGIAIVGAYAAGELLRMAFAAASEVRRAAWSAARRYMLAGLLCLAASLVNPYTYHLHVHVFQYLRDPFQSEYILEFLTLSFHHPVAIFFEILLLAGAATAVWNLSQRNFIDPVLMALWAHGSLLAARNIPIFVIVAAPPVAAALQHWIEALPLSNTAAWLCAAARKYIGVTTELADADSIGRWHPASALGVLAVAALLFAPHPPAKFRAEFDPQAFPAAAVDTLRSEPAARIFAYDQWGDYLIYRLYPHTRVFLDGRSDFYGADFEKDAIGVERVKYDWEKTLSRFGIDTILLSPATPLAGALKESRRWRLVYDDGVALVFRSASPQPGAAIPAGPTPGGLSRDREITKTEARDRAITKFNNSSTS
jgi:hypothetical protein